MQYFFQCCLNTTVCKNSITSLLVQHIKFLKKLSRSTKCTKFILTWAFNCQQYSLYQEVILYSNRGKKLWRPISFPSTKIWPLTASNCTFMSDSQYLGTISDLAKLEWTTLLFKFVICQIDAKCSSICSMHLLFTSSLKLIYYNLISNFSIYYFKTGTICLFFLTSPVFTAFDSTFFGVLLWNIVKLQDQTINWKNIPKIHTNQTLFCDVPKLIVMLICKQKLWQM